MIALSIINKKKDLMASFNREKTYFKAFVTLLRILKISDDKFQFIKFYFYSVYKSFI